MESVNIEFVSRRKFDQAVTVMRQLPTSIQLSYEEKLVLQALYKQSLYGPCPNTTVKGGKRELEKWTSWTRFRDLATIDAQEQYFLSVIQILSKHTERPHIVDIIESLERGSRISAIQSLQPKSLVRTENMIGQCSSDIWIEDNCEAFTSDYFGLDPSNGRLGALSDYSLQEMKYSLNSPVELESSGSEGPDYFSDDSISLSTCTVKARENNLLTGPLNRCLYTPPTPSLTQDSSSSPRSTADTERALETLQTQVAALNERLERLQLDMQHSEITKYTSPSSWVQYFVGFIRRSIVNMVVSAFVTAQIYRNRPIPNFVLLLQLVFPTTSFFKLLLTTLKKLLR